MMLFLYALLYFALSTVVAAPVNPKLSTTAKTLEKGRIYSIH